MHREPIDVVARRDLYIGGSLVRARYVHNVDGYDRETGGIFISVAPPGSSICTQRAIIARERYPEFRIRWEWRTSTERGGRAVQLGALALLAPIWIVADVLVRSGLPVLERFGHQIHPKRGR